MKKLLLFLLALPILSAAQTQPVQGIPYSCGEGNAFTIRIPVRIPAGMSVEYVWYRNDIVVKEVPLTAGVTAIAYTIPDTAAHGYAVAYHFRYRADCDEEWSLSPRYLINFLSCPPPQGSAIAGSAVVCTDALAYAVPYEAGAHYTWVVPAGWVITSGRNTYRITVVAGTAGGTISVTPSNSCGVGATRTLAVSVAKLNSPGVIDFGVLSCSGGITTPGVIGFDVSSCSGGVSDPGVIGFAASSCSGDVISAGTISVAATN